MLELPAFSFGCTFVTRNINNDNKNQLYVAKFIVIKNAKIFEDIQLTSDIM